VKCCSDTSATAKVSDVITTGKGVGVGAQAGVGGARSEVVEASSEESSITWTGAEMMATAVCSFSSLISALRLRLPGFLVDISFEFVVSAKNQIVFVDARQSSGRQSRAGHASRPVRWPSISYKKLLDGGWQRCRSLKRPFRL
jgi:uncharacterized membrane protein